ncbi:hypothetical protein [Amycolatopsis sp. NPDC058986]|uniref:hypothetical protein n=1 Tax=unclassified Amycolatopsis TaxID=2618356 RepID=UPI003671696D
MLRKIAFGAGAAMAALGLAVSVPSAAMAAPSTGTVSASAASGQFTTQGTWVYVRWYSLDQAGKTQCGFDALAMYRSSGRDSKCYERADRVELWTYYG